MRCFQTDQECWAPACERHLNCRATDVLVKSNIVIKKLMIIMYIVCVSAHECRYLQRPEEGAGSPAAGVTGSCELPCVCWELSFVRSSGRTVSALNC